jgi:hypothetical protein
MMATITTPLPARGRRQDDQPGTDTGGGLSARPPRRSVQLQINTGGAWRRVLSFNYEAPEELGLVHLNAPPLAIVAGGTLRIATDDGLQTALEHWDLANGWRVRGAA